MRCRKSGTNATRKSCDVRFRAAIRGITDITRAPIGGAHNL
jgi:hypothetical protein